MRVAILAAGLLASGAHAQPGAGLTMTCNSTYKGNALGPQVYRVDGVELVKTAPAAEPIVLSSAVKRHPLDRTVDGGVVTFTSASHRLRGPILTRTVFWSNADGKITRTLQEVYDFRARTIRGLTPDLQRCR